MASWVFSKRLGISLCVPIGMGLITGLHDTSKYSEFDRSLEVAPVFTVKGKLDYADIRHRVVGDKKLSVTCGPGDRGRYCIPHRYDIPLHGCFALKRYRSFNIIYGVTDCRKNIIVSREWRRSQIKRSADHMRSGSYWESFLVGFIIGVFGAIYCYYITLKPEPLS